MTDDGLTVVLGWDGLDYQLATELGVADAFGAHHHRLETFDNETLGKPHTAELWPSIITGSRPESHGIYAAGESGAVAWENPLIHTAAQAAQYVIPDGLRTRIGALLRSRGAETSRNRPEYYREQGETTIFKGRRALPVAIPNYHTETDARFGVLSDRGAQLAQVLDWGEGGWHEPGIPTHEFTHRIAGEAHKKLGIVRDALRRDYDIIFVWLGYLDSIGHIAPAVEDPGLQQRAYRQAAEWTRELQGDLTEADTLITVSDHGLRSGYHTHDAFLGSSEAEVLRDTTSVTDVKAAIERVTPRTPGTPGAVRSDYNVAAETPERSRGDVREQLEELGYI